MSHRNAAWIMVAAMVLAACGDSTSGGDGPIDVTLPDTGDVDAGDVPPEVAIDAADTSDILEDTTPDATDATDATDAADSVPDADETTDTGDATADADTATDAGDADGDSAMPDCWSGDGDGGQWGDWGDSLDAEVMDMTPQPDGSDTCSENADCPPLYWCKAAGCVCLDGYECGGVCLDVQTSVEHCGECGNACGEGAVCNMGMCACGDSEMDCDGVCSDPLTSNENCGWCGNPCAPGSTCKNGSCKPAPPRLIWPPAGSTVGSTHPVFEVELPDGGVSANIKICANPACTSLISQFLAAGGAGAPSNALSPGVVYWNATTITELSTGLEESATWPLTIQETPTDNQLAWGVGIDFDHDNRGDVLTGGCGVGACTKKAYLFYSEPPGIDPDLDVTLEPPPGLGDNLAYGWAVESAGDINGDGHLDVIIGGGLQGGVYVHWNSEDGMGTEPTNVWAQADSFFGFSVSSAGDVNRDGYGDVMVGTFLDMTGGIPAPPKLHVHHGGPNGLSDAPTTESVSPSLALGSSIAGGCDVNGDGFADVVAGAAATDEAFIFHGGPDGLDVNPSTSLSGTGAFGIDVACAGDVNGDGYADVLVGAPNNGEAYLYLGSLDGLEDTPSATLIGDEGSGIAVCSAGDVNGDGHSDIAIGGDGKVDIYLGNGSGVELTPDTTLVGDSAYFGDAISAADTNGDKLSDLLVTQVGTVAGGETVWSGKVSVYLGSIFGVSTDPVIELVSPDDDPGFGFSIAGVAQ
jgi:hypothetical protein